MIKTELLMPAGNIEAFKQALFNGADAIYLGMKQFSARASSNNFSKEDYLEAITLAHKARAKIYVTINTLLNEDEIIEAIELIDFLYVNDVDAIIIQDIGLLEVCSSRYPDLDLHISTQMFIHNEAGIKFLKEHHVTRIVVARETPLDLIKKMCELDIEIEVFVYGALCTSYSGQCLFSSVLKDRSANKGRCAQLCRLPYQLKLGHKEVNRGYLLSLKDLNMLSNLKELVDAKVASLKVEGRMKRSEYVGLVTRYFKDELLALAKSEPTTFNENRLNELKKLFNRGFTTGYILEDSKPFNHYRPNHLGVKLGNIIKIDNNRIFVRLVHPLNQHDGIRILSKHDDYGMVANKIYINDLLVNSANSGDIIELDFSEKVYLNDIIVLTSDVKQLKEISRFIDDYYIKRKIEVEVSVKVDLAISIRVIDGEFTHYIKGDEVVQKALKQPITKERIIEQLAKVDIEPYSLNIKVMMDDSSFISINQLNKLKRSIVELIRLRYTKIYYKRQIRAYTHQLKEVELTNIKLVEINKLEQMNKIEADIYFSTFNISHSKVIKVNPLVHEQSPKPSMIMHSIGDLFDNDNEFKIALPSFNVTNHYALAFLYKCGANLVYLSTELNKDEVSKLVDNFIKEYGFKPNIGIQAYGRRNMMIMKYCVIRSLYDTPKFCNECLKKDYSLSLDGIDYPLTHDGSCHQIILENKALNNDDSSYDNFNKYYRYTIE